MLSRRRLIAVYIIIFFTLVGTIAAASLVNAAISNEGRLIKARSSPRVYVISRGERRWIQTYDDFIRLGYQMRRVEVLDDAQVIVFPQGTVVTAKTGYPDNTLLKGSVPAVFVTEGGKKRHVKSQTALLLAGFSFARLVRLPDAPLNAVANAPAIEAGFAQQPQTFITAGPGDQSVIADGKIIFRYIGQDASGSPAVTFQTKVEGLDRAWVGSGTTTERTVVLPDEQATYVVFVRAIDRNGVADETPAYRRVTLRRGFQTKKLEIVSVDRGNDDPSSEHITLNVVAKEPVNVMGWRVGNDDGNSLSLGLAQTIYSVHSTFQETPFIPPRGIVRVITGRSPIGVNVRLNRCMGYLAAGGTRFVPGIRGGCPSLSKYQLRTLSGACRRYVEGLGSCKLPRPLSDSEKRRLGSSCIEWANAHLNYQGCIEDHSAEPTFLMNEWRFYLGSSEELWAAEGGVAQLRDPSGEIVDTKVF